MEQYLEFRGIDKAFPGVQALKDISFRAEGGQVTALVGENGAGKSTLLKILSGDLKQDAGQLILNGEEKKFSGPNDAIKNDISVIYQERQLMPQLTVMENIFLEDLPRNKLGILNKKELKRRSTEIIAEFGLKIDPQEQVGRLSVAYQQMVEIMKAYRRDSQVIAFDEPTASLADGEITILFELIEKLKQRGKVILYVSHRMKEIFQLTDRIAVLKDGRFVRTFETKAATEQELITSMVGRDIGDTYANLSRNDTYGDTILEVKGLTNQYVKDISFNLKRGEVLGFSGLVGAGRTEVVRAIFGADPVESGEVILRGEQVHFESPKDAIEAGMALCPEDRKEQGLVLLRSISDNVTMPALEKVKRGLFLDRKLEDKVAIKAVEDYAIKTTSVEKPMAELSGGNQQKVILGRWTSELVNVDVLIMDEPTKGIDVSTKAEIYQMVCDLAKQGKGVIFISSEMTEVMNVSDRIIVMHNGRISGEIKREEATEQGILELAMRD